ncbi:MAG: hypothetical protein ACR2F4_05165 [Thermoleophilaceae bacterium]
MHENLDGLPGLSIWNLSPLWVVPVMVVVFAIPALMRRRVEGRFTDDHFIALLLDLMLVFAVFLLVLVAWDTTPSEDAWYTTLWWYLPCLVAAPVAVFWLRGVRLRRGRVTVGGRRNYPELVKTIIYALIAWWVVALIPAILLADHIWATPIQLACLAGMFLMPWAYPKVLDWANEVSDPPIYD